MCEDWLTRTADTSILQYWLKWGPILCAVVGVGLQILLFVVGLLCRKKAGVASISHNPMDKEEEDVEVNHAPAIAEEEESDKLQALTHMLVGSCILELLLV